MPRIEQTDWLETFVAVAEHGSFSAAAAALHRSQSRVSTHVLAIEKALGGRLFDRSHRPISLTDLGREFLPHARGVLERLDRAVEVADRHHGTIRGRVVIGCHPSVSGEFLPPVLARLHAEHPQVRVELTEHTTPDLVSGIDAGRFHLAIHSQAADPPSPELESFPLWREGFIAVAPTTHPLAVAYEQAQAPLAPQLLLEYPLIAIARPGAAIDPDTGRALLHWGVDMPVAWQTEQPQTVVNLARAGLGVGLLNALAAQLTDSGGMAMVPVGSPEQGRITALTRDPRRFSSAAVDAVAHAILQAPRPRGMEPVHRE